MRCELADLRLILSQLIQIWPWAVFIVHLCGDSADVFAIIFILESLSKPTLPLSPNIKQIDRIAILSSPIGIIDIEFYVRMYKFHLVSTSYQDWFHFT